MTEPIPHAAALRADAAPRRRAPAADLAFITALRVAGDIVIVPAALLAAYWYRFHLSGIAIPGDEIPAFRRYLLAAPVVTAIWVLTFAFGGRYVYRRGQGYLDEIFGAGRSVAMAALITLAAMSLYREFSYSRLILLYFALLALVLIVVARVAARGLQRSLQRRGVGARRVLVVGIGQGSEMLVDRLRMFPDYGYSVVGVLTEQVPETVPAPFSGLLVRGAFERLEDHVVDARVDDVFLAQGGASQDRLLELARRAAATGASVRFVPDLLEVLTESAKVDEVGGLPLIALRENRLRGLNLALKRTFDLVAGGLCTLVALVPMAVIAVAVRVTSPGPAIFRQERVGRHGRPFTQYKFRSMRVTAGPDVATAWTTQDDPRRTPIGRWLRRLSLDELPQLFNVLRGDMSLVGPRPERAHFVAAFEQEVPRYLERLTVPPGLTGWAQVNDLRGDTSIRDRTIYDLYYVEHWSLAFDARILLATLYRILRHRHAY